MTATTVTRKRLTNQVYTRLLPTLFFMLLLCAGALAQGAGKSVTDGSTPLALQAGAPAGAFALSGFESVNPYNGGLNFTLPLLQIGGRGGVQHTIPLMLEQKWRTIKTGQTPGPFVFYPNPNFWEGITPGYGPGAMNARMAGINDINSCASDLPSLIRLTFTEGDGTEHEFRDVVFDGQPKTNLY